MQRLLRKVHCIMNFYRLLTVIITLSCLRLSAEAYSVKGVVTDSVGQPESFATLRVYHLPDSIHPSTSALSGEDGGFAIPLDSCGDYRLNLLSFGKGERNIDFSISTSAPVADLGKIEMANSGSTLDEVVVTAQRPLISKEIDRIGYDVQADTEAKTSQLDEILKKVPLVSVDPDGTIKVKGSTDFKIYKNGRPNNSFSRNAKDIFKALPASMIKKIEVITDPGSREDAEGTAAILNIVTMENTVIKGVMGNVGLTYRTNNDSYPAPNIWLSTQIDKFTLSLYGGSHGMSRKGNRSRSESLQKYEDSGNELYSESNGDAKGDIYYFGIDTSLELDTLNLFTAEFGGYAYNFNSDSHGFTRMLDAAGNTLYSYNTLNHTSPNRYFDFNGNFNYQRSTRRKDETIIFSYMISTTDQKQHSYSLYEDIFNLPVPYTGTDNDFHLNFIEHTGQIDWSHPINEHNKFDLGAKYINRSNHSINNQTYFDYKDEYTNFLHRTQVLALYYDYRIKYGRFGARAGLRYEYSHLSAKYKDGSGDPFSSNLSDWVPNASVSYDINDANTIKFSYSTRINRPGISQLNPAVVSSPSSISSGNPDLSSSRHQSIGFNYNFLSRKINLDFNASYSFSNNAVIFTQELIDGDITRSSYANAGRNRNFSMSLWTQWTVSAKTSLMLNGGAQYNHNENGMAGLFSSGWSYNAYLRLRQQLPWEISLSAYAGMWKSGPNVYSYTPFHLSDLIFYGLSLDRSFLKERRLNIRIDISNPFGKSERLYESIPRNTGYTGYSRNYNTNSTNVVGFSVSYRFGSLNASVKKTAKSISNDDLEGRKN